MDQNLLTIFIAVTAVAVVIQSGILAGFYFVSTKVSRRAEHAIETTRTVLVKIESTAPNVTATTARIAEFSETIKRRLQEFEHWRAQRTA